MPVRIAIVGPGRVGTTCAERFVAASADVMGFVGRDPEKAAAATARLGLSGPLTWADLARAHVGMFAVGDDQLAAAVAAAAGVGGRRCSLWLHTSGRHDLSVLAPAVALGARVGALHPLAPFAASLDEAQIEGAPALVEAGPRSESLLRRLCAMLGLQPIVCGPQDRALYHAACALAANGATALFDLAREVMVAAGGLTAADAGRVVEALMGAAVAGSGRHGPGPALSGPVRRGDADTVEQHLDALARHAPAARSSYVALMQRALALASREGLSGRACDRVAASLEGGRGPGSDGAGRGGA